MVKLCLVGGDFGNFGCVVAIVLTAVIAIAFFIVFVTALFDLAAELTAVCAVAVIVVLVLACSGDILIFFESAVGAGNYL